MVLFALPSSAAAKLGESAFTLHATNGYQIRVFGGDEGSGTRVSLEATRDDSFAEYSVKGTITPTKIKASFGRLGLISLRFHPSGRVRRVSVPKKCRDWLSPAVAKASLGSFVGAIRFHGESGYTKLSARRVSGAVGEFPAVFGGHGRLRCIGGSSTTGPSSSEALQEQPRGVSLLALVPHEATSFFAFAPKSASVPADTDYSFIAMTREQRGRVEINRSASVSGPPGDFIFDNALSSATVTPPSPFSGSASFQRNADTSTSWTGSLSVSLPGKQVSLTGVAFKSQLSK